MNFKVKKFIRVKEDVAPAMLRASLKRFWDYIKGKQLQVMWEDKSEYHVIDAERTEYNIPKDLCEVVEPKEVPVG